MLNFLFSNFIFYQSSSALDWDLSILHLLALRHLEVLSLSPRQLDAFSKADSLTSSTGSNYVAGFIMSVTSAEAVVAPPQEPLDEMAALAAALPGGEESAAMAREKGWVVPQRYNYEAYNALNKDMVADALPWASNSAKYEWKEEYGDVGPPNEELEQMLFKDEYIPRVGKLLEKYVSHVELVHLRVFLCY